jgi:pilus assembly protein Flp/PilA
MLAFHVNLSRTLQSLKDESGQDLIEYALLAALISVATIAALSPVATAISTVFSQVASALTAA